MNDSPLMSLDDIAALHRCTLRHAREVIVRLPGFPKEAPTSTQKYRVWVRHEVLAFLTRAKATVIHHTHQHGRVLQRN